MNPVEGWRKFRLHFRDDGLVLQGYYCDWPGPLLHAECLKNRVMGQHKPFDEGYETPTKRQLRCLEHLRAVEESHNPECGIYIIAERDCLDLALPSQQWPVEAEVTGWGVTAEMERGWRVEFCRVDRVYLRRDRWPQVGVDITECVEELTQRYHVPVEIEAAA